jgi:pheromone shutdown protein TraB
MNHVALSSSLLLSILNPLEAAVGNSLKGLYEQLGKAGYKPGEEFKVAIQEGSKIGAAIVLGDQDADVTIRRLTQALLKTNVKKLLAPDSELEQSMKALLPQQTPTGGTGGSTTKKIPSLVELNSAASRQQLTLFVEHLKERETIQHIMSQLKRDAPLLYQVMVTERDAYMALGLDTLHQYPTTVSVVGMAHMDGMEQNLRSRGWKPLHITCPRN